ncbi:hypothetical protein UlMin_006440 [Ulmus minor]
MSEREYSSTEPFRPPLASLKSFSPLLPLIPTSGITLLKARTRAAKVGKGLSKDEKAQKLALKHWLEVTNLEKCPRSVLQRQFITYLGPKKREAYQVIVENGKLVYKQSGEFVDTIGKSKWIFVLNTTRSLYVGEKKKGSFQYSSFLVGAATTAVERLVAHEGVLKNFREFINLLEENHVDLSNVKVNVFIVFSRLYR